MLSYGRWTQSKPKTRATPASTNTIIMKGKFATMNPTAAATNKWALFSGTQGNECRFTNKLRKIKEQCQRALYANIPRIVWTNNPRIMCTNSQRLMICTQFCNAWGLDHWHTREIRCFRTYNSRTWESCTWCWCRHPHRHASQGLPVFTVWDQTGSRSCAANSRFCRQYWLN